MNKIIAVVGQAGSGKDTAASYIEEKYGYRHISTADILRDYIKDNNLGDLTRENMSIVVQKLRDQKGNDILVKIALRQAGSSKVVLSALRHPDETKLVIDAGGVLIDTVADIDSRYQRNLERGREGDSVDFDSFKKLESRENSGKSFDVKSVEKMASYNISNSGSYEDFYLQINKAMKSIIDNS